MEGLEAAWGSNKGSHRSLSASGGTAVPEGTFQRSISTGFFVLLYGFLLLSSHPGNQLSSALSCAQLVFWGLSSNHGSLKQPWLEILVFWQSAGSAVLTAAVEG